MKRLQQIGSLIVLASVVTSEALVSHHQFYHRIDQNPGREIIGCRRDTVASRTTRSSSTWTVSSNNNPWNIQSSRIFSISTTCLKSASTATSTFTRSSDPTGTPSVVNDGKKRLASGMAFLTGWADVMLTSKLATFCTMMTGNLLWMIKALSELRFIDALYYVAVFMSYGLGLAVYRHWQTSSTPTPTTMKTKTKTKTVNESRRQRRFLPTIAATITILFVVADTLLLQCADSGKFLAKWIPACMFSFGFALINGVGTDTAGTMTFVITGHMTKLVHAIVDADKEYDHNIVNMWNKLKAQPSVVTNVLVLLSFMAGALFANALRLSVLAATTKSNTLMKTKLCFGQFAWIGILMGSLFLWKDSLSWQQPESNKTRLQDIVSREQTDNLHHRRRRRRRWRLANPFRRQTSLLSEATVPTVTSTSDTSSTSSTIHLDHKDTTMKETGLSDAVMTNESWHRENELPDSNMTNHVRMSTPDAIRPLNATVHWVSTNNDAVLFASANDGNYNNSTTDATIDDEATYYQE